MCQNETSVLYQAGEVTFSRAGENGDGSVVAHGLETVTTQVADCHTRTHTHTHTTHTHARTHARTDTHTHTHTHTQTHTHTHARTDTHTKCVIVKPVMKRAVAAVIDDYQRADEMNK